jgi:formylglycine-generating enzyme required for sulfatase activity
VTKGVFVSLVMLTLCSCSETGPRGPLPSEIPQSVKLSGGSLVAGFANGSQREGKSVQSFNITKYPITVAEYRQCVAVGACTPPASETESCTHPPRFDAESTLSGATYDVDDGLPVTCTKPEQAQAYCAWQGGSLPTLNQWMLASRGSAVHRYAWGDRPATCADHPSVPGSSCPHDRGAFRVGGHNKGGSPSGMEDALLTRSELLQASRDSQFPACSAQNCIIQGIYPGSIDSVRPAATHETGAPFGFRCVTGGGQ